ncbi:hypothetical protein ACJJTC_003950 [Scirpophaga incertulas]
MSLIKLNFRHLLCDELKYELKIRGHENVHTVAEMRSRISTLIKTSHLKVTGDFTELDIDYELETCENKLNDISSVVSSGEFTPSQKERDVKIQYADDQPSQTSRPPAVTTETRDFAMNTGELRITLDPSRSVSKWNVRFGREIILDTEHYKHNAELEELNFTDREDYVGSLVELKDIFLKVKQKLNSAYERGKKIYNRRKRDVGLKVGQVVWKKDYILSKASENFARKLAPRNIKCVVEERVSPLVYRLRALNGRKLGLTHIKDIIHVE